MDKEKLQEILIEHGKWARGEGGSHADLRGANLRGANLSCADLRCANLRGANLRGANFSGADLSGADLSCANLRDANFSGANLRGANFSGADLSCADLRGADLSGADLRGADLRDAIYDGVNWLLLLGIVSDKEGKARAYKMTNSEGEGPFNGGINYLEKKRFSVRKVDPNLHTQCSYGINLATLPWCFLEKQEGYRLFLMEFEFDKAICPIGSDGKFRVKNCTKIGECNWKGELIDEQ